MKKHYTAQQKAKIVLEILKEERSIAQIASEHGIHSNQLYKWKAQTIEKLSGNCLPWKQGDGLQSKKIAQGGKDISVLLSASRNDRL